MQKLPAVEEARRVLREAMEWSIWRWLSEKKRVRTAADAGAEALDRLERKVKAGWPEELKKAYREIPARAVASGNWRARYAGQEAVPEAREIDTTIETAVRRVKEADDQASRARLDAEALFAEAERALSGDMARQGAEQALRAYDLREAAIRKAEAAAES